MPPQKQRNPKAKSAFKGYSAKTSNLLDTAYDRWLERGAFYEMDIEDWNWNESDENDVERNVQRHPEATAEGS